MALSQDKQSTQDLLQAQLELWHHTYSFIKSMALKCAMDLRIPDAIHHCGGAATLSDLVAKIKIDSSKLPQLRRLMRVLTVARILGKHEPDCGEAVYELTPAARLLVTDREITSNLSPNLGMVLNPTLVTPFLGMGTWFLDEQPGTSLFQFAHGRTFWEMADQDDGFNRLVNNGMFSDSCFTMEIILKESSEIFKGINSLIDVAGGRGAAAMAIAKAFPQVKCSVLDLSHVVAQAPADANVEFVAGDMFVNVPPADAVFLKWVLHDWSDEKCVKILQQCKKAIPPRDAGGKVIIVDMVVGFGPQDIISKETQVLFDLFIMFVKGAEREEHEWKKIFLDAGFSDYKIIPVLGFRSVIELYP